MSYNNESLTEYQEANLNILSVVHVLGCRVKRTKRACLARVPYHEATLSITQLVLSRNLPVMKSLTKRSNNLRGIEVRAIVLQFEASAYEPCLSWGVTAARHQSSGTKPYEKEEENIAARGCEVIQPSILKSRMNVIRNKCFEWV